MFKSPTVFIIGAGASCEAGLPTGTQLANTIAEKLNIRRTGPPGTGQLSGDPHIVEVLMHRAQQSEMNLGGYQEYFNSCLDIREGLPLSYSIDEYMDSRKEDKRIQVCGKIAITASILEAEQKSKLWGNPANGREWSIFDNQNLHDTWHPKFFRMLSGGVDKDHVQEILKHVSFVIFNYDRCIEYFLTQALRLKYGLSEASAQEIMDTLKIYHTILMGRWGHCQQQPRSVKSCSLGAINDTRKV